MTMLTAIRNSALGLSIFAVITAGAIAVTQVATVERIEINEREQRARALYEIVPKDSIDNNLLEDTVSLTSPALTGSDPRRCVSRATRWPGGDRDPAGNGAGWLYRQYQPDRGHQPR